MYSVDLAGRVIMCSVINNFSQLDIIVDKSGTHYAHSLAMHLNGKIQNWWIGAMRKHKEVYFK